MATDGTAPTFGLWYDFRQKPPFGEYSLFYAECLEEIEEGERLGFIAARTVRIRIGTNVLHLPMHHPLRVAEDATVVDLVSGGRFILGVGQGYVQHEFETLGFDRKYRPSLFEEGIEVIRQASMRLSASEVAPRVRYAVATH